MAAPLMFQSLATRLAILACFWITLLASIPSWLRLTTNQRLPLPTRQVEALQHNATCPITFPASLGILVDPALLPTPDAQDGTEFLQQVEQLVQQSLDFKAELPTATSLECMRWSVTSQRLSSPQQQQNLLEPEQGRYVVRVLSESSLTSSAGSSEETALPTVYVPLPEDPSALPLVPDTISAAVISELLHLRGEDPTAVTCSSMHSTPADRQQDPRVIQYSKHIRLVFSIMNQDSTDVCGYDSSLIHALARSGGKQNPIGRVMEELKGLHDFHVETQVQWFAPLAFAPTQEVLEAVVERQVEETVMVDEIVEEDVEVEIDQEEAEISSDASQGGPGGEQAEEEDQVEAQLRTAPKRRTKLVKQPRTIQIPRTQRVMKQTRTPLPPRHLVEWDDLKVFVNSEEWSLTSTAPPMYSNETALGRPFDVLSQTHDLHFLLYVPSKSHSPLLIRDPTTGGVRGEERGAWLIPQWGGVVILNTPHGNASHTGLNLANTATKDQVGELPAEAVAEAITLFSRQLEILLGLPRTPSSSAHSNLQRRIALTTLTQKRMLELTRESHSTLLAITRLVNQIKNLGVGPAVKEDTQSALSLLRSLATSAKKEGLQELLESVKGAYELSNRAFFNPDMLGLLYFPDQHKYAVYTPLFAPLLVPLLVTSIKLVTEAIRSSTGKKNVKGRK
ncbi:hypothetical protein NDA13_003007 [Ustilago tritici]|nr:hypothetical protein NDA13_003007 [Ustilago tritici]